MKKFALAGLVAVVLSITSVQAEEKLDPAMLKANNALVLENRATAIAILKSMGVATSKALPAGGEAVDVNHNLFVLNQMTFKQLAAKVGAKPVTVEVPVGGELVEQNHIILLGNREIMLSVAAALKIEVPTAKELTGSFLEKNNVLLTANKMLLAKIAEAVKK